MLKKFGARLGFALALAAFPQGAFAQSSVSAPALDVSSVDCSTAPARMMAIMTPAKGAIATANADDADKAYATLMQTMVMRASELAKIERKCGKNAKAQAMATKMEHDLKNEYDAFSLLQQEMVGRLH